MGSAPPISKQVLVALGLLFAVAAIAFFGSQATIPNTEGWYRDVAKVPWNPPNSVFGPAWSVLYLLIAVVGWLLWRSGWTAGGPNQAAPVLRLYWAQLVLNALWTPIFFAGFPLLGKPAWWIALAVILALLVCTIVLAVRSWQYSRVASLLLVPYVLWLGFATSLNVGIIALN